MSKTKNREGSEIRFLQGEIRRQAKIIRHLESQLRAHEKHQHMYEISQDDKDVQQDSEDTIYSKLIKCDDDQGCGKGVFQEMHIGEKIYGTCTVCERRKRLK